MNNKENSEPSDEVQLENANKKKSKGLINAALIGAVIGIAIYSITKNGFGLLSLILVFFVFWIVNKPGKGKTKSGK